MAHRLDGVAVRPRPHPVRPIDHCGNRLEGADLVVGPHDRDQGGLLRDCLVQRIRGDQPAVVDGDLDQVRARRRGQPARRIEDGMVLDRTDHQSSAPLGPSPGTVRALDRQVVRLGATGGEDHLGGLRPEQRGDLLAGLLDHPPSGTAGRVQRGRVSDDAELGGHRLDRGGHHRGGRRVVEIGPGHGRSLSGVQERWGTTRFSSSPIATNERDLAELVTAERGARLSDSVTGVVSPCAP